MLTFTCEFQNAFILFLVAAGSRAALLDGLHVTYGGDVVPALAHVSTVPIVQQTAAVPVLAHYQSHIHHAPIPRRVRAPDYFDPAIPAFQTTLYAPAAHHLTHHVPILAAGHHYQHAIINGPVVHNTIAQSPLLQLTATPVVSHVLSRSARSAVSVQPVLGNHHIAVSSPIVAHSNIAHIPGAYVSTGSGISSVTFTKAIQGHVSYPAPLIAYAEPSFHGFRYGGTVTGPVVLADPLALKKKS